MWVRFMDVKLPKLGEGADSGVVVSVFVKEGDTVAKDQAILELENEKAVASIPSTATSVMYPAAVSILRSSSRTVSESSTARTLFCFPRSKSR